VDLLGHSPYADYLAAYSRVDVALDPFPYNGGATSIESLWMGVPIVSLRGDHFVSRMGASILATAGLPELVAESAPEYVDKVVALAMDWGRLSDLRADLRARLARSPLFDGPGFARGLEAAYRQMWTAWCQQRSQAHRR
jgi:predicted O-linked N-acetylglucosamine transferase (SPINDLY family)